MLRGAVATASPQGHRTRPEAPRGPGAPRLPWSPVATSPAPQPGRPLDEQQRRIGGGLGHRAALAHKERPLREELGDVLLRHGHALSLRKHGAFVRLEGGPPKKLHGGWAADGLEEVFEAAQPL